MNQRIPRKHDRGFLRFLRQRACVACGFAGSFLIPIDPAHIRAASAEHGKRYVGMGERPDDRFATPLCRTCHDAQHAFGSELEWWKLAGLDPFAIAAKLYAEYGGDGGYVKRKRTTIKPRLPKEQRRKIQSRGFR